MSDTASTDTAADASGDTSTDTPNEETDQSTDTDDSTDLSEEVAKWKAQARKHEERAKANAKAAKELEEFRKQSMSETEQAIEQARSEGRREALTESGAKVAAAEVRAAAAGRIEPDQLEAILEGQDLSRFLNEDGEPDSEAVTTYVDRIAPKPDEDGKPLLPDLGQGVRTASKADPGPGMGRLRAAYATSEPQ